MTRPNGLKSIYAYDNLSRLLSVLHQSGSTTLDGASYAVDNAGNGMSKTDQLAGVTSNYAYDSFGKQTSFSGSLTNPFQYTTRESDTETGLYYYRARYYDAGNGRFISEDPIGFGGGDNFYVYVVGNPALFNDPYGLWRNTGTPSNPHINTIVCNGQGGIRVQLVDCNI